MYLQKRQTRFYQLLEDNNLSSYFTTKKVNFQYITGFTGSTALLLTIGKKVILFVDPRYTEQANTESKNVEVREYSNNTDLWLKVKTELDNYKIKDLAIEADNVSISNYNLINEQLNQELIISKDLIAELRIIKDEHELEIISKACNIADDAFAHILSYIKPGVRELDIAIELEQFMRKKGASGVAFSTIVASGKRSALPHGVASDKNIEQGDFVTLDFGALYNGYCSDITRTVVVGKADEKQLKIYNSVLETQKYIIDNIKAGLVCQDVDAMARQYLMASGFADKFVHSLGHGLGMEVHENPRLAKNINVELAEGMVVTVEPGLYFNNYCGVRIEDDVLITEDGCQVLTKSTKKLIELN